MRIENRCVEESRKKKKVILHLHYLRLIVDIVNLQDEFMRRVLMKIGSHP